MKHEFKNIDEILYEHTLSNGLKVFLLPKVGFTKTYTTLTSAYGSIHNTFIPVGETEFKTMPEGIAHFLEHKMFEKEDGDMFHLFSKNGASANAFTSYDRTSYLFTSTNHIKESIELLLKMVQQPYFSQDSVEKEVGIISEEIKMYQDQPNYKLYHQTIQAMYHIHPVRQDIAGSLQSIRQITSEHLYTCYNTFYRPENMVMFIVGNVEVELLDWLENHQFAKFETTELPINQVINEPSTVVKNYVETKGDVSKQKWMFALKGKQHQATTQLFKTELAVNFILDILFGEHSDFYHDCIEEGLIDDSFGFSYTLEPTFSHILIGSSTNNATRLKEKVLYQLKTTTFDEETFGRLVKQSIGEFISSLNSIEYIANQFTRNYFQGSFMFDMLPILESLTLAESVDLFKTSFDLNNTVESRMLPNG